MSFRVNRYGRLMVRLFLALSFVGAGYGGWEFGAFAAGHTSDSRGGQAILPSVPEAAGVTTSTSFLAQQPTPTPEPIPFSNQQPRSVPIFMYHYIRDGVSSTKDPIGFRLSVSPQEFEAQVSYLVSVGLSGVTMADVSTATDPHRAIVLTFDDGYADFYTNAFPILRRYNWKAVVYVITEKVGTPGYLTWDQIDELQQAGIEIGSHTVTHRELNKLSPEEQRQEITLSKLELERHLGRAVTTFCYPVGRYANETVQFVEEAGYLSAVTTASGIAVVGGEGNPYILPRVRINPGTDNEQLARFLDSYR